MNEELFSTWIPSVVRVTNSSAARRWERAIVGMANLTTSTQGVAKIEEFKSRVSALADEEVQDAFYRPVAAQKLRAKPALRFTPENASRDTLEDTQEEDAFLRSRRRVPIRKGWLPRTRVGQFALAGGVLVGLATVAAGAIGARELLKHDARFRIDSSDSIKILGNSRVTRAELLSVFGSDIGRNVFFIPLAERRAGLESLPWVEHATVMRVLPNQMRVAVVERTPVAFVRNGNEIGLVDGNGVLLPMPSARADDASPTHYSFPVVTGIDPGDPLSTRAARMHIYKSFIDALDASGEKISAQLSEIDLSDPEDVKAVVEGPGDASGSDLLLHFGDADFLARYRNYESHLPEWRRQYPRLTSIDLRYERQVVLEMAKDAQVGSAASTPSGTTMPASTAPSIEEGGPAAV
ncbi:MAG TPA: FtsQ-type POTRA domain-containing protein, partial [Acidisarcina sp.]